MHFDATIRMAEQLCVVSGNSVVIDHHVIVVVTAEGDEPRKGNHHFFSVFENECKFCHVMSVEGAGVVPAMQMIRFESRRRSRKGDPSATAVACWARLRALGKGKRSGPLPGRNPATRSHPRRLKTQSVQRVQASAEVLVACPTRRDTGGSGQYLSAGDQHVSLLASVCGEVFAPRYPGSLFTLPAS